jgi:hypothetical protein
MRHREWTPGDVRRALAEDSTDLQPGNRGFIGSRSSEKIASL